MKKIYPFFLSILFFLSFNDSLKAQWVKMARPFLENISSLAANKTDVFAGTPYGVFYSTDNGANWKPVGLANGVYTLGLLRQELFTSTSSGLYSSTYDGDKWNTVKVNFPSNEIAVAIKSVGSRIYAATKSSNVYLSKDGGKDWFPSNHGIGGTVQSFAVFDTTLFAGTTNGLYVNTSDTTWDKVDSGLNDTDVKDMTSSGTNLYGLVGANVYRSTDGGKSWSQVNNGIAFGFGSKIAVIGSNVFVGSSINGLFMSQDSGKTWVSEHKKMPDQTVKAFVVSGNNLYLGTDYDGAFLSTNEGVNWYPENHGLPTNNNTPITSSALGASDSTIFVGTQIGVYSSSDSAKSLTKLENGLMDPQVETIAVNGKTVYVGSYSQGIFRSTDNGKSWTQINNGLTNYEVTALLISGNEIYAGTYGAGVFKSTNGGESWTAINSGMDFKNVISLAKSGNNLFAGTTNSGVFWSKNDGMSWTEINSGLPKLYVSSLVFYDNKLYAGILNGSGGVFQASYNGTSWEWISANSGLSDYYVNKLIPYGNVLFAQVEYGVWMKPGSGSDWKEIDDGLSSTDPYTFTISNGNLYFSDDAWGHIWRRPISDVVTGVQQTPNTPSIILKNYPNPFYGKTEIIYKLPVKETVELTIYNSTGQKVATLINNLRQNGGTHEISWNSGNLPEGTYFCHLTEMGSRNITETKAMVLMK